MMVVASLYAADKLEGVKCPVSGKAVKEDKTVAYKDGKVYFCCENCPKAFTKDSKKFATKANAQLVATGQAKQAKCPISGQALNPDTNLPSSPITVVHGVATHVAFGHLGLVANRFNRH